MYKKLIYMEMPLLLMHQRHFHVYKLQRFTSYVRDSYVASLAKCNWHSATAEKHFFWPVLAKGLLIELQALLLQSTEVENFYIYRHKLCFAKLAGFNFLRSRI